MKKLSSKQLAFLKREFGITDVDYSDKKGLEEIRLKCFDIETNEAASRYEAGNDDVSIGIRGDMAVSIIDDLYDVIHSDQTE